MNENKNLVLDEGTENVGATATEEVVEQVKTVGQPEQVEQVEPEKIYTKEEFNTALNSAAGKRAARKEAKVRKEFERDYGELVSVLEAGTGVKGVKELTAKLKEHYGNLGVQIETEPKYSTKDIEVLAQAEADDIIKDGFDEVYEEAKRLNELGVENMSARDRAVFLKLTNYIKDTETSRELSKIGVGEDVANSEEFKTFAAMFKSDIPIKTVYEEFIKTQPKKEIQTMGSMKNTTTDKSTVKDYYSYEEAVKFTQEEINSIPGLYEAIRKSMAKW